MKALDKFRNKNILFICKESFSWPMHNIAKELRSVTNKLNAFYIQPGEAYFQGPEYKTFKSLNSDIRIHEMSAIVEQYLDRHKNAKEYIDWNYIKKLERDYSKYASLNQQLISEVMTLLPYYHDRDYYDSIDYNKILLYVQLYYQYVEKLFKENTFDVILDLDVDFFGRAVLLELAAFHDVPYVSIDESRLDDYCLPTLSGKRNRNTHIEHSYNNFAKDKTINNDPDVIKLYQRSKEIIGDVPDMYKKIYSQKSFGIFKLLREVIVRTLFFYNYFSWPKFKLNFFHGLSSPICSHVMKSYKFKYLLFFRRFYLEFSNIFDEVDLKKINYIYTPLHVIPESSTSILGGCYSNETFIIEALSQSIPADQYIVVKEHWDMIGFRPISYYKKIKKLPNIILINPSTYSNPGDFIANSDLVVTISGSAGLEAAFMGVNSLIFSDVIYGLMSSAKKIDITPNLRQIIVKHKKYKMPERELFAYLKVLLTYGSKVRINELLVHPDDPSLLIDDEMKKEVNNLLVVFSNGMELYEKEQIGKL